MELSNNGTAQSVTAENAVASIILSLACLVGVPGNALVIWIILFSMKRQRSPTVMLILNLAIADLFVLITLPLWIYAFVHGWAFGEAFCKILTYLVHCNVYVSVFLITVMSVERFMAVVYPFATQRWRRNEVIVKVVLGVWVLAFLFSVPALIYQVMGIDAEGRQQCMCQKFDSDEQEILCTVMQVVVAFVIPFSTLSTCYLCIGRKIKRMTFKTQNRTGTVIGSVVIVFLICWVPHHIVNLVSIAALMTKSSNRTMSERLNEVYDIGVLVTGALAFLNSCINPVLYAFAARNIRREFRLSALARLFDQLTHSVKEESRKESTDTTRKDISVTMEEMHSVQHI
ncbi:leukotriene B4 receptor 1-like [Heptranchias perlo]|uniref:leukotriene B4 receptor 1-like n=1 Tax=Heptranchias perlo TaxID=212740 RepID=UPI00355A9B7D